MTSQLCLPTWDNGLQARPFPSPQQVVECVPGLWNRAAVAVFTSVLLATGVKQRFECKVYLESDSRNDTGMGIEPIKDLLSNKL